MALPPDPLEDVLPLVTSTVMAEVTRVLSSDVPAPHGRMEGQVPSQVVELRVDEVLWGSAAPGGLLTALKPVGAYALRPGNRGPFLLGEERTGTAEAVILGRYGPDTYRREEIEAAARQLRIGR